MLDQAFNRQTVTNRIVATPNPTHEGVARLQVVGPKRSFAIEGVIHNLEAEIQAPMVSYDSGYGQMVHYAESMPQYRIHLELDVLPEQAEQFLRLMAEQLDQMTEPDEAPQPGNRRRISI